MAGYKPAYMKTPSAPRIQTFTFNDGKNTNGNNGGMNTRLQADQIRSDQSPDMLNMCYREGVPCNRFGFNTAYYIGSEGQSIRGLHACTINNTNYFLAVCDGKLIVLNEG
jgi:hypothetical protein